MGQSIHRADYCAALRPVPVAQITTEHVLKVIGPIWHRIPETASRVRIRIEMILSYAATLGWRSRENPAAWRNNIKHLLPKRSRSVEHLEALPVNETPSLMQALRANDKVSSRALEFTILTGVRSNESREMEWEEVDFGAKEWRIPKERMKAARGHIVPLSPRAVAILEEMRAISTTTYVFQSRKGKPLSDMAFSQVLDRLGFGDRTTTHGLRSTFRDWAGDNTEFLL
jgi:integrase